MTTRWFSSVALGQNCHLLAGADDKPCRPGDDGGADWRRSPALWVHDDVRRVNPRRDRPIKFTRTGDVDRDALAPNPGRERIELQQRGRVADGDSPKSLAVQRTSTKSYCFINERTWFRIDGRTTVKPRKNVFRQRPQILK